MTRVQSGAGWFVVACSAVGAAVGAAGCGNDAGGRELVADEQTPPQGFDALEAWLADGASNYKTWAAEPAIHESRRPSPHGFNRIYSNAVIAGAVGDGIDVGVEWPMGAAAVKEIYADATATSPKGYAVYLKLDDDSNGGASWYWYERLSPAPTEMPDRDGVVDGRGDRGGAKSVCVGCHQDAGLDVETTPTVGGRDFVFTPVR